MAVLCRKKKKKKGNSMLTLIVRRKEDSRSGKTISVFSAALYLLL